MSIAKLVKEKNCWPEVTHQSSRRVRDVQLPHTPHCQTCAAEQRLFPEDRGEDVESWRKGRTETRERTREGEKWGEQRERKREKRRSYFTKVWKPSGGLNRGEIPPLHKNTGAQDLAHFSVGRTPALWDTDEQKHTTTHTQIFQQGTWYEVWLVQL